MAAQEIFGEWQQPKHVTQREENFSVEGYIQQGHQLAILKWLGVVHLQVAEIKLLEVIKNLGSEPFVEDV